MKHVFLCFVLLFLGSTTAVWGETLSELQQRAESGDSDAQYDLAMRYWEGKEGAPKDDSKAFYWAKKAAEQGNAYAQSWVGYFYENAYGTARDFGEAAYWYRRSADQGNRFSQNNLGECYYYGRGVERSYEKAVLPGVPFGLLQPGLVLRKWGGGCLQPVAGHQLLSQGGCERQ